MFKKRFIKHINPLFLEGIAHRGLHNARYSENGMDAFKNAMDHHMAIELDIHLTKDKELVVFHDSEMKRMTGKDGIIEDLTLQEIKNNYRLLDGERIPTFKEVLEIVNETVPIVVELKVYRKNYIELVNKAREVLKVIKDKKNILLISFDPRALSYFKHSGFRESLLVTTDEEYKWIIHLRFFFDSVDLDYKFLDDPKIRRYQKHHFTNIWTIENKEVFDKYYKLADTVTFQHIDPDYVRDTLKSR